MFFFGAETAHGAYLFCNPIVHTKSAHVNVPVETNGRHFLCLAPVQIHLCESGLKGLSSVESLGSSIIKVIHLCRTSVPSLADNTKQQPYSAAPATAFTHRHRSKKAL
ncbi:hypothetical protein GDO78_017337 [Eleutherodactylus coqui]|uniref:Uncharacterized protein n=1 Tax=Eleutherodactylus coqui TaxID=57060 RepID=A0A8J6BD15_ELECQ|nr:hypothetical protein GDO78_017337 [Eleutherodactylus coqui]